MRFFIIFGTFIVAINALSDHISWIEFKDKHTKEYNLLEDKFRFQVFQKNLRKIEQHNAKYEKGQVSYFLTTTKFADWTEEEFKAMLNRQADSKPKVEYTVTKFNANLKANLPGSVDWRKNNSVSEVKDQGLCGSSWAFSAAGSLEGQLAIKNNNITSLSEQEFVDCSKNDKNNGCSGGFLESSFNYVKDNGLSSEEDYPYTGEDSFCKNGNNPKKIIAGLSEIKTLEPDEDSLAAAIANIGPISVSVDGTIWSLYGGGIFDYLYCGHDATHAALAVGYEKTYWIIKNSWGEHWGEDGYMKLIRGKNMCGVNLNNYYGLL